jgi:hypothetical protein
MFANIVSGACAPVLANQEIVLAHRLYPGWRSQFPRILDSNCAGILNATARLPLEPVRRAPPESGLGVRY